jgi:thioredoxin
MSTSIAVLPITDTTFDSEVALGTGVVAVEFSAEWCAPCRMMAPTIEALAREYAPKLRMMQLDGDANPATLVRFGVRGMPTMLIFRDGEIVDRIVGAVSKTALRARIERVLNATT